MFYKNIKMKKLYLLLTAALLSVVLFYSCKKENFLDKTQSTDLNQQTVFADSAFTMDFLNAIYANLDFSVYPTRFGNAGLDAASDESEGPLSSAVNTNIQFASGTVNPNIISDDAWRVSYVNIRRVNMFLRHIDDAQFDESLKARAKSEARFLRAWYYGILIEHYGGVPIIGDTIYTASDTIPSVRNTYEQCVNYIVSECDAAAQNLPWEETGEEYGRINKAACVGLKSRILLYAASPLFNGSQIATSEPLKSLTGYSVYSKERWKLAQDAALELMNSGKYALYVDNTTEPGYGFYEVFTLRKSSELILARMVAPNAALENIWLPPSRGVTNPAAYPYLETANAFGMKNGLPIDDPNSGYDPLNPYNNRDPRFNNSIIHDQSLVEHYPELLRLPVNLYIDATNPSKLTSGQDAIYKGTPTGYYTYKMLERDVDAAWWAVTTNRCFPLIRYAEILLNYAEARNEYISAPDQEVYDAVEAIRKRAGLDPYQLNPGLSQAEMRKVIQNERQIELAFEGHRFWDVRRWKIAAETQNQMMHGTEPTKDASGTTTYKTVEVREHNFTDKMYLWPIPQSEISKSPRLLQNPEY